jgi:hypothetical protein
MKKFVFALLTMAGMVFGQNVFGVTNVVTNVVLATNVVTVTNAPTNVTTNVLPIVVNTNVYKVTNGDYLVLIAEKLYGGKYQIWRQIYASNTNIIKNPTLIYPNQILIVPNFNTNTNTNIIVKALMNTNVIATNFINITNVTEVTNVVVITNKVEAKKVKKDKKKKVK